MLIMDRGAELVVAQVGAPLLWPRRESIPDFWRGSGFHYTITSHNQVLDKSVKATYVFYPSEWESVSDWPLVLLEMVCWPYDPSLQMC
jgi:hypothetical protein